MQLRTYGTVKVMLQNSKIRHDSCISLDRQTKTCNVVSSYNKPYCLHCCAFIHEMINLFICRWGVACVFASSDRVLSSWRHMLGHRMGIYSRRRSVTKADAAPLTAPEQCGSNIYGLEFRMSLRFYVKLLFT